MSPLLNLIQRWRRKTPFVKMDRRDGLGERLSTMICAIILADALKTELRFSWTSSSFSSKKHKYEVDPKREVLPCAVCPSEELFSSDFLHKFEIPVESQMKSIPFPSDASSLQLALKRGRSFDALDGSHMLGLGNVLDASNLAKPAQADLAQELFKGEPLSSRDAFQKIGFAQNIVRVIKSAREQNLGEFVAVHLRSGDIVYSGLRKTRSHETKVINPSIVSALCQKFSAEGKRVVLFGQAVDEMRSLQSSPNIMLAHDLAAPMSLNLTEQAMFEMSLMSCATKIIGAGENRGQRDGISGFVMTACLMGHKPLTSVLSIYSKSEYALITLKDLELNHTKYHSKMVAYSYWQAYLFGKDGYTNQKCAQVLNSAAKFDPDNLRYPLTEAAHLYRAEQFEEAESLLASLGETENQPKYTLCSELKQQLSSNQRIKRPNSDAPKKVVYTHQEIFEDFAIAARNPNNKIAIEISTFIDSFRTR